MRTISYVEAINETLRQIMEEDKRVFVIGQGVTSPWYVGSTTTGLIEQFGPQRIIDTPVSENGVTGVAIGARGSPSRRARARSQPGDIGGAGQPIPDRPDLGRSGRALSQDRSTARVPEKPRPGSGHI